MAERSRLNTMMMRVNPVIINRIAGRKLNEVSSSSVCRLRLYVCTPPGAGVLVNAGKPVAADALWANPSSNRMAAAEYP